MQWFALYVKSRHEFITNNELRKKQVVTFLPSFKLWRQWKDRRKLIDFPLFPGYLFVHIHPHSEAYLNVLKTRGAVTFVSLEQKYPAPVSPDEIDTLKILLDSGKEVDVYPHLKEGTKIRIKRGPLKGAEGIFLNKEQDMKFLVNINLLGRSVGLKIYADEIEDA
ncbi:MAG: UpxY family transcription antiterminator [Thermodesulfovibrionales bacterium]|nr:UpxY family transcription antiterminator [Thermodesulfovibrionales bacterium]